MGSPFLLKIMHDGIFQSGLMSYTVSNENCCGGI